MSSAAERIDRDSDRPLAAELGATEMTAQRILVGDMVLSCTIGVSEEERATPQRLRFNLMLELDPLPPREDEVTEILSYAHVVRLIRDLARDSRYKLLESLAESIAEGCFAHDRVRRTRVRIEKLDRYAEVGGIGIEIERRR